MLSWKHDGVIFLLRTLTKHEALKNVEYFSWAEDHLVFSLGYSLNVFLKQFVLMWFMEMLLIMAGERMFLLFGSATH